MSVSLTKSDEEIKEGVSKGELLPVMESFYTIQGEGAYTGHAAYFIRLAGCDVGCVWCDVKESWDASIHPIRSIEDLLREVKDSGAEIVVITGGEPLMYNLDLLTRSMLELGVRTHIETSGAHPFSGEWNWFCLSPKKFKTPLDDNCQAANELKIIVFNKSDFKWAESFAEKVGEECLLLLQPEWDKQEEMIPLIVDYVKRNPQWKVSLQTHKYLNVP